MGRTTALQPGGQRATSGGVWQATLDHPAKVESLLGVLGRGGYEGTQADSDGNIWIEEDIGGSIPATQTNAKVPNSFLYRFIPKDRDDLTLGGELQALRVTSLRNGQPIVFQTASALTDDIQDLHTYGLSFRTRWVTVHDTDVDGFATLPAKALAKTAGATPFKRPENGQFRPGSRFREFFFDETGDTSNTSAANPHHGGWGSVLKLAQSGPSATSGRLTLLYKGDRGHAGFDNCAFRDEDHVVFVEDRGDGLNEGDNEITGIHVSDGDASAQGILGAKRPHPFEEGWRVFYTGQHGDNNTVEVVRAPRHGDHDGCDRDDHR